MIIIKLNNNNRYFINPLVKILVDNKGVMYDPDEQLEITVEMTFL